LLVAFHLIFSFIFILILKFSFGYPPLLIPLHVTMVAILITGATLFMGFMISFRKFREWRFARYILSTIPAVGFSVLVLLYITDIVSNRMWGHNVTLKLIVGYTPELKSLAETLPLSFGWLYYLLAGVVILIFCIYMALSGHLFNDLQELFLPARKFSLFRNRTRAIKSSLVLVLLIVGFIGFMLKYFNEDYTSRWDGEPIANLFMPWSKFRTDPHRLAVSLKDCVIRADYPSGLSFKKKNVVILIADSLRADHMQIYGYERPTTPFLADLLEKGHLRKVRHAFSTCCDTHCGILSTMASRDSRSLCCNNFKLHDLLKDQGYRVNFILSDNHIAWYDLRRSYGRNIDFYYDGSSTHLYPAADDRLVLEGLERVPDYNGTPAFFFLVLMSPHIVGVKHEAFERYRPSKLRLDFRSLIRGKYDPEVLINRYDNGVIQADAFIRNIFTILNQKGYLHDSLVVILADHGDALGEHGRYAHTVELYQEEIAIPMLIYDEAEFRYANLEFATQIDVAPTIIDRLGLPIPSCWQGKSLLDGNIKHYSYHQTQRNNPWRAVIYRTDSAIYKYLRWDTENAEPRKEELYEILSDPGERLNLMSTADSRLILQLRKRMSEGFDIPIN